MSKFTYREMTELEVYALKRILKHMYPKDDWFYCDRALCSENMVNIGFSMSPKQAFLPSYVSITDNGAVIMTYVDRDENEEYYILRDIFDEPCFVEVSK